MAAAVEASWWRSSAAMRVSIFSRNSSRLTQGFSVNIRVAHSAISGLPARRAQFLTSQYASRASRPRSLFRLRVMQLGQEVLEHQLNGIRCVHVAVQHRSGA
jgi:hypothetical protein